MAITQKIGQILGRIRLPRQCDVILVQSRNGWSLPSVSQGFRTLVVDPTKFDIFLSLPFIFHFVKHRRKRTRITRYLLGTASACNARIIIATDATKELTEVANSRPDINVFAVMHGLYIDQKGHNLRESWKFIQDSSVTLIALGPYDLDHYRRWGNNHKVIKPLGSLNNCLYVTTQERPEARSYDLCIVQGTLNPFAKDHLSRVRLENWEKIASLVHELDKRLNLKMIIAIRESSKQSLVENWFAVRFPRATFVRTSDDSFATYRAIDSAWVSVGEASTSLIEGLARKNRCLAMNFSSLQFLTIPAPSLVTISDPSYDAFERRYHELRNMSDDEFWRNVGDGVSYLMNTQEQHLTIQKIRDCLKNALTSVAQ